MFLFQLRSQDRLPIGQRMANSNHFASAIFKGLALARMLTLVKQIRVARYQSVPFQHLRFTEMSDLGGNFVTDQTNLNLLGAETIQGKDPKASNTLESPNPIVRQPMTEANVRFRRPDIGTYHATRQSLPIHLS